MVHSHPEMCKRQLAQERNDGRTPLGGAIEEGDYLLIDNMVSQCKGEYLASLMMPNNQGETPFYCLGRKYFEKESSKGESQFFLAGLKGSENKELRSYAVAALIAQWPREYYSQLFSGGYRGQNAFHYIAKLGCASDLSEFFSSCPDAYRKEIYALSQDGDTVLHSAASNADSAMVNTVLEICNSKLRKIYRKNNCGETPLLVWIAGHRENLKRGLIKDHEDLNVATAELMIQKCPRSFRDKLLDPAENGQGLLHIAASSFSKPAFLALIDIIPVSQLDECFAPDKKGRTPLHLTAGNHDSRIIDVIFSKCPKNRRSGLIKGDKNGNTLLHRLAIGSISEPLFYLKQALDKWITDSWEHVLLVAPNNRGESPLKVAALNGMPEVARVLLSTWKAYFRSEITDFSSNGLLMSLIRGDNSEMCTVILSQLSLSQLGQLADRVDIFGKQPYQYCLAPPYTQLANLQCLWPSTLPHPEFFNEFKGLRYGTLQVDERIILELIVQRYPKLNMSKPLNWQLVEFIKFVRNHFDKDFILHMLEYDFKMNPALPLNKIFLESVLDNLAVFWANPRLTAAIRLGLQTHPEPIEILSVDEGVCSIDTFPEKTAFFKLPQDKQKSVMTRAVVLRQRAAISCADRIVKDAVLGKKFNPELLTLSLRLYRKVGASGSKNIFPRLAVLFKAECFDEFVRGLAVLAFAELNHDRYNREHKEQVFDAYASTPIAYTRLKICQVEALGNYQLEADDEVIFSTLMRDLQATNDAELKRAIVQTLMRLPIKAALEAAAEVVESDAWDELEERSQTGVDLEAYGDYLIYPYRPTFHDSRFEMRRMIAERYVQMRESEYADRAQVLFNKFKSNVDDFPMLAEMEQQLQGMRHGVRYFPQTILLPPKTIVTRGICERKGNDLLLVAIRSVFMEGAGSADLSLFNESVDEATFAKAGQIFTSLDHEYVMNYFYTQKGLLMLIRSEEINRHYLEGNLRYQKEISIHAVSYCRIKHPAFAEILAPPEERSRLEKLARKVDRTSRKLGKIDRIIARRLLASDSDDRTLLDRVHLFTDTNAVKDKFKELGVQEASVEMLIAYNIRRQIIRAILFNQLEGNLKEYMAHALGLGLGDAGAFCGNGADREELELYAQRLEA